MNTEHSQLMVNRPVEAPRFNILFLVVPLILMAVWFAGVRPSADTTGTVIVLVQLLLCGTIVAGWRGRTLFNRIFARFAAGTAILAALGILVMQLGGADSSPGAALLDDTSAEAWALLYLAMAIAAASGRGKGKVFAALTIFIPVQLIQYSVINLYSLVGGIPELGPLIHISAFSSAVHFMMGLALLVQVMMRHTTHVDNARVWPKAAAWSALTSIMISLLVTGSGFASVVAAMSGAILIATTFLGCRAAVTRSEMFRVRLKLKRQVRREQRQRDELLSAESDYEELFEQVPIGVMKTVDTGQVIRANSRMCGILGYQSVEQLIATDLRALFADPEKRRRDFLTWKNSGNREWNGDVKMLRQDGSTIIAHFTGTRVNDSRGNLRYVLSCYEDVTAQRKAAREIRKLESDLRLTHKLEAVGRLAAGVAHEINTPMQYIGDNVHFLSSAYEDLRALTRGLTGHLRQVAAEAGNTQVEEAIAELEEEVDLAFLDESVEDSFQRTLEGVRSVADIVRSMKEFAYPNDKQQVASDINGLLTNTLTVSRSMYAAAANVVTEFKPVPPTFCFPGELNQVFVNLVVNAAHAVEKANQVLDRPIGEIRIATRENDGFIEIDISDNGTGMPDAVRERIFDPFFTTKEVGKGTGQGLAIAHSIITDKHGGTISVTSESGKGTTFTVRLPIRNTDMG